MKDSDPKKFLLLFDAYFADTYKYVARRIADLQEVERITKLTFLDASGQIQNTPTDTAYPVWLFSLAKPRVASYINKASFPKKQGLIDAGASVPGQGVDVNSDSVLAKADGMFKKLTMEEAEILRLKFFEELADGDVHYVIGGEDPLIGPKIYRVLKRAHFLLFGESNQRQGVYFGELSGFLERAKDAKKIEIPEAFKLSLRAEISSKLDRKDFAVNVPVSFKDEFVEAESAAPWKEIDKGVEAVHVGSNDPAKIFVEAVREMREEEALRKSNEVESFDRAEMALEIFDKIKGVLIAIPVVLFVVVGFFVVKSLWPEHKIERGIVGLCPFETQFGGEFNDAEKLVIDSKISKEICKQFNPKSLIVDRLDDTSIKVSVDVTSGNLLYDFVQKDGIWKMKKYAKTPHSNTEQRKIQRNI
jgi:DNA-directed RNA polymerase specialized sigma24 family protein